MNSSKPIYLGLFVLFLGIIFTSSCKKEDVISDPVVFYNDGGILMQFRCINNDIEFFVDNISDLTDGLVGDFPDADACALIFDYNNNGDLDAEIDLSVGQLQDGRICVSYLKSQTSTTPCQFYSDTSGEMKFSSTANSTESHMNYTLRIPKSRISESNIANIAIRVHNAETGWTYIPDNQSYFEKSIEIEW